MTTIQDNSVSPALLTAMNVSRESSKNTASATQDRFMTLLVTQMKNQDPLNPLDNAQVTSQLAQLSTVTGIDQLNETLKSLMGSFQSSQSLQAANMIGHGVLVPGSNLNLAAGQALFGIDLAEAADTVQVSIRDASGQLIRKLELGAQDAGMLPSAWDGIAENGAAAANGQYSFEVSATRNGQKIVADTLGFGEVASVSSGSEGVKLNVTGLGTVNLADIRQIL